MKIMVTGGAGYVGSHALLKLLGANHEVAVFDNFSNSSPDVLERVRKLAGANFRIYRGDIRNTAYLEQSFAEFQPDAVMHFAGLKSIGASNDQPLDYYSQNVTGSIEVLKVMQRHDCRHMVFSSSATVYGECGDLPCDENHSLQPTNPYGRTKYFVEEIIRDWTTSWRDASAVLLRYFNPVGADPSGQIGEDGTDTPNNLTPHIARVAAGLSDRLNIYGGDYDTIDGTGERDYIHVDDLAQAHLAALDYAGQRTGCEAINIGTGLGTSVLEMIAAMEQASGRHVPYVVVPRRSGDVARSVATVDKAERLLNWTAKQGISNMCKTAWDWQTGQHAGKRGLKPQRLIVCDERKSAILETRTLGIEKPRTSSLTAGNAINVDVLCQVSVKPKRTSVIEGWHPRVLQRHAQQAHPD